MNKKLFNKLTLGEILIFFFTLITLALAGLNPGTAQAQMTPVGAGDSNTLGTVSPAFQCTISTIASVEVDNNTFPNENRIYVRCSNSPGGGIVLFTASAAGTNGANANRYLALLNTAVALGKTVTLYYDLSTTNNPIGCQPSDCRKLTGLVLGP